MTRRLLTQLLIVSSLFVTSTFPLPSAALLEENTNFQPTHDGADYPVGFADFQIQNSFSQEFYRMLYPAMTEGQDAEMAGNGPFPWVLFFGDTNEQRNGYDEFASSIVKRGYIVLVAGEPPSYYEVETMLKEIEQVALGVVNENDTGSLVSGSAGNIDVHHWGIAGHGVGATSAYAAFPYWGSTSMNMTFQPPRALFGLAIDFSDWDLDDDWFDLVEEGQPMLPSPNSALFITGTSDSVSPSTENRDIVEGFGRIGWHWMHLLGANHYQFQDTQSIFETDNDASLSQEEQIGIAGEHVVAYLDTVLRADEQRYASAFNREDSRDTPSDSTSYISENMTLVQFLTWQDNYTSPENVSALEGWDNLTLGAQVQLRNGTPLSNIPQNWTVEVECGWMEQNLPLEIGQRLSNDSIECTLPMMDVSPGTHTAFLRVFVNKNPAILFQSVTRTNTPIELIQPLAEFLVPQRGSSTLLVADIGVDPDGQIVRAVSANLSGQHADHFSISILENGEQLTVTHVIDEEWIGEADANITLQADGMYVDQRVIQLRVMLLPVDDPVQLQSAIPQQVLIEDGPSVHLNLSDIVIDPEGAEIVGSIDGNSNGQTAFVSYEITSGVLTLTPLENASGAEIVQILLGDGTNSGVLLDLPIRIDPVDDAPFINYSLWRDIELNEDESFNLDLSTLAYDIDGDELVWTYDIQSINFTAERSTSNIVITPMDNFFGDAGILWLEVTDQTTTYQANLSIIVLPVADAPLLSIQSTSLLDETTATIQWYVQDFDGAPKQDVDLFVNEVELVNISHSCIESDAFSIQCVSMLPLPYAADGLYGIEIKYFDDELQSYKVAQSVLDSGMNESQPIPSNSGDETSSAIPFEIVGGILGISLVLGIFARVFLRQNEEEYYDVEQSSEGLLARAQQHQK